MSQDSQIRHILGHCYCKNDDPDCWYQRNYELDGHELEIAQEQAIQEQIRLARIDELTRFEPFCRDHTKCVESPCIPYQNATSDFDKERFIRIDQLKTPQEEQ